MMNNSSSPVPLPPTYGFGGNNNNNNNNNSNNNNNNASMHANTNTAETLCIPCLQGQRITPNGWIPIDQQEAAILSDAVRLNPCGCTVCKDCFLQYMIQNRSAKGCPCCGTTIRFHRTALTQRCPTYRTPQTTHDGKLIAPIQCIVGLVEHEWERNSVVKNEKIAQTAAQYRKRSTSSTNASNKKRKNDDAMSSDESDHDETNEDTENEEDDEEEQEDEQEEEDNKEESSMTSSNAKRRRRSFPEHFLHLKAYRDIYGTTQVPKSYKDKTLAGWVKTLRQGKYQLTQQQRDQLDSIGFLWVLPPYMKNRRISFQELFSSLRDFQDQYGTTQVPKSYPDKTLAGWVKTLRQGKYYLTDEERAQLDSINFLWTLPPKTTATTKEAILSKSGSSQRPTYPSIDDYLQQALDFKARNGYLSVNAVRNSSGDNDTMQLAEWLRQVENGRVMLSKNQKQVLTNLGFVWNSAIQGEDQDWNEKYEKLSSFKVLHGHCNVPDSGVLKALCRWCRTQRNLNANGQLPVSQKMKLEDLDFPWILTKKQQQQEQQSQSLSTFTNLQMIRKDLKKNASAKTKMRNKVPKTSG